MITEMNDIGEDNSGNFSILDIKINPIFQELKVKNPHFLKYSECIETLKFNSFFICS